MVFLAHQALEKIMFELDFTIENARRKMTLSCTINVQTQNLHRSIGKTIAWFAVWIIVKPVKRSIDRNKSNFYCTNIIQ